MLKIKDNIDLKELEKFGFKEYPFYYFTDVNKGIYYEDEDIAINKKNRQVYMKIDDEVYEMNLGIKSFDYLYDLIKADLVEKVGEIDNE